MRENQGGWRQQGEGEVRKRGKAGDIEEGNGEGRNRLEVITEHGEFGPPRAQCSLCGLALIGSIIGEFGICDLQVVLTSICRAHDPVPWPGCRDRTGKIRIRPSLEAWTTLSSLPRAHHLLRSSPKQNQHPFQVSSPHFALSWAPLAGETLKHQTQTP